MSSATMKFVLFVVFVVVTTDGAYEGDSCDAFGTAGVCRKINNCSTAIADIRRKKPPPTCGYDNDQIIICCRNEGGNAVLTTTKRYTITTTTEYIPQDYEYVDNRKGPTVGLCRPVPDTLTTKKTGQKAFDKCIEYQEKYVFPCERSEAIIGGYARKNHCNHNADELIIQGVAASKWEFPHMALLGYQNEQGKIVYQCGGAIISEKFILTAGHCISDTSANNVSHVLVGILKRSEESNKNRYVVRRVIPHRDYLSPSKYNDIALLELEKPIPLDYTTVPACLHIGDNVDESRASVTGWGSTVSNRQVNSNELRKVIVSKFSTQECSEAYSPYRHLLEGYKEDSQICYGDKTTSVDTCMGDSGGPLTIKSKKIGCMYNIIGVTSFGQYCGTIGVPGIYTRVSRYLRWIEDIVWPNYANNVSHVLVGILKRSEESNKNRHVVKRVIPHRDYLSPSKYNDIALLELEKPIPLDYTTVPACLHIGDNVHESRASATGWGSTVSNRQVNSDELRKVIVSKFSTQECSDAYAPYRHLLEGFKEDSQICYGDKTTSVDTCMGDSGGPLTIKSKKIDCMYTIVGVTSFGHYCGTVGVPGIYTRVSRYLRWIEDIVWPN